MPKKEDPVFNTLLVEAVEKYPCLYNYNLNEYSKRESTQLAWESIAKEVNDTGLKFVINMSLNIKIGPSERDESSDEDSFNMVAPYSHHPKTTETHCSICLGEITNACYTNTCIHMFCFECLKTWSATNSTCPLCKKLFQQIHHSLREFTHVTYRIQRQEIPNNLFMDTIRNNGVSDTFYHAVQPEEEDLVHLSRDGRIEVHNRPYIQHIINVMRTRVYREDIWAEPLPDTSGQFRDCSPTFFSENPAQVNRLLHFIYRDVHAINNNSKIEN